MGKRMATLGNLPSNWPKKWGVYGNSEVLAEGDGNVQRWCHQRQPKIIAGGNPFLKKPGELYGKTYGNASEFASTPARCVFRPKVATIPMVKWPPFRSHAATP